MANRITLRENVRFDVSNLNFIHKSNNLSGRGSPALTITLYNFYITVIDFNKEIQKHAVKIVRKCIDKSVCENFHSYFKLRSHNMNTTNNNIAIELPKCKLEFSKRSFYYMGAKIYKRST